MKLGTESRVKTITAISLLVIGILVLVWQLWPSAPSAEPTAVASRASQDVAAATQGAPVARRRSGRNANSVLTQSIDPRLRLDLLNVSESTKYEGKGRNIFRGEAEPAPVIEKPVQTPIVEQGPPQPPPPPPINLKFFGFANRPGEAKQVFLSQDGDVFVAREGDIVNRRYKIVRINPTSIEVEDVLSNNRQSIPLQAG